jgi:hypothetical protein
MNAKGELALQYGAVIADAASCPPGAKDSELKTPGYTHRKAHEWA